jgi:cytoskeletal protein CcmA (bactofilin family)
MFSSSAKHVDMPYTIENRPAPSSGATTIARGVKVEGDFASQGDVVIEGEVHGKISAAGTLTIGPEAVIKADVTADEANISGLLEGNLTVKKQVVLHATARIKGDLIAERATVESGAVLDGRVQIGHGVKAEVKATSKSPITVPAASTA